MLSRVRSTAVFVTGIMAASGLARGVPLSASAAGTASISGTVTDDATATGRGGIDVTAYAVGSGLKAAATTTDYHGGYTISGLPAGSYVVEFDPSYYGGYRSEFVTEYWKNTTSRGAAQPVTVAGGAKVAHIDAALASADCVAGGDSTAGIAGTVAVPTGFTVSDATVYLYDATESSTWHEYRLVRPDGTYCFSGLEPGTYKLKFGATDLLARWWNQAGGFDTASTVSATATTVSTGIDATLDTGASISGTLSGEQIATEGGWACATTSTGDGNCAQVAHSGDYRITGLPSGQYTISFTVSPGRGWVDVGGEELMITDRQVWWDDKPGEKSATLLALGDHEQRTGTDGDLDTIGGQSTYPVITGEGVVGATLSATAGIWDLGTDVKYQWATEDDWIAGANSPTFTLTSAQAGKTVRVIVFGRYADADDNDAWQAMFTPLDGIVTGGILKTAAPAISGTVAYGSTLTAKPGAWTPGTGFTYQWYANGVAIAGATKATLKLGTAQKAKKISVRVMGKKLGFTSVAKTSAVTGKVATAGTPKISGKAKIGKKLTAKPGTWTKGTKFSYQWYANGVAIKKATKSTLTLKAAQKGKKITVKVTGKKSGYATVTTSSKATGTVKK